MHILCARGFTNKHFTELLVRNWKARGLNYWLCHADTEGKDAEADEISYNFNIRFHLLFSTQMHMCNSSDTKVTWAIKYPHDGDVTVFLLSPRIWSALMFAPLSWSWVMPLSRVTRPLCPVRDKCVEPQWLFNATTITNLHMEYPSSLFHGTLQIR